MAVSGIQSPGDLGNHFTKFRKSLRQKASVNAPIHCECAIAVHFIQEILKGPTLSFIGLSKPSLLLSDQLRLPRACTDLANGPKEAKGEY